MVDFAQSLKQSRDTPQAADFASSLKQSRAQTQDPSQDPALAFAKSVTGQEELRGPGLTFGERFVLGLKGDTPEEKRLAFEQKFPEGEYVPILGANKTLIRRSRDEPFQIADPSIRQAFGEESLLRESLRDVGDIAGDLPEIGGEIAAFAIGKGATGPIIRASRAFLGGAGGSQAQQEAQTLMGTQRQDRQEQLQQSVGEGTISLLGGLFGEGIGRAYGAVSGRKGLLSRTPEGERAVRANERLGGDPLLPQQVAGNPLVRLMARQSQATVGKIGEALRRQNTRLKEIVRAGSPAQDRAKLIELSERAFQRENDQLLRQINKSLGDPNISFERAAQSMQPAIREWWHDTSRQHVDELYDAARSIEAPSFDITPMQRASKEVLETPAAKTKTGDEISVLDPPPALREIAEKIRQVDPQEEVSTDFIRGLREDLFDLTLPGPAGERRGVLAAKKLRNAVTEVFRNPQNTDESFVNAWKSADNAARDRFQTRELLAVSELIRTDRPVEAVQSLVRPGNGSALQELKRALPGREFEKLREAFKADLLSKPDNALTRIERLDSFTKRQLLTPAEEKAIRNFGQAFEELESTGIRQALSKQNDSRLFIRELTNTNNSQNVARLRSFIGRQGGKESALGKSTRAAIMDDIIREATTFSRGTEKLGSAQLNKLLNKYRKTGVLSLLTNDEKRLLSNVRDVQSVIDATSLDAGTSIQAAETASGIAELSGAAIGELIEKIGIGRVLTNGFARRLLTGKGKEQPLNLDNLARLSAIAGTLTQDLEQAESSPDISESFAE